MKRLEWVLVLAMLGGCTAEPVTAMEASEDESHEAGIVTLEGAADIESELRTSPAHFEAEAFVRATVLYWSPTELPLEIATSEDGREWSAYEPAVMVPEGSDDEVGVWLADVEVVEGDAHYYRVRQMEGAAPTQLSIGTATIDELAAELLTDEDEAFEETVSEDGVTAIAASGMHRYRFDFGSVTRTWHWLLRNARRRGWRGSLYGERTGLRTYAQQLSLWNAYQNGTGNPAFPPWGPSRHLIRNVVRVGRWYQAVDTSYVPDLIRIARNMGVRLHTPYSNEPWHVEATRAFSPPRGYRP